MVEGSGPNTVTKKVPTTSGRAYDISKDIGHCDASIKYDWRVPGLKPDGSQA